MAIINDGAGTTNATKVDVNGTMQVGLFDAAGNVLSKIKNALFTSTTGILPIGGVNDITVRPIRVDRFGGMASASYTPLINFSLFTAALPPVWLSVVATQTNTYATASGSFLNASGLGTASSQASMISMTSVQKLQKSPLFYRTRARMIMGATNGQCDLGLSGSQAPGTIALLNGFVFLYGADGTLKPTIYTNGSLDVQGADIIVASGIAAAVLSAKYLVWDIIVDDDSVTFILQDPITGTIINEQTLQITAMDPRFGMVPYWFAHHRTWVTTSANVGAATQLYVADCSVGVLDGNINRPYTHTQPIVGMGSVVNPTIALTQLSNNVNSTAPASATLSNTAAGYTTLGGQFQFAAVAGAETDYALFGFTVPTGVKFVCTGIVIDTLNTGAAVATTATWLQWFLGIDGTAVTLASANYRVSLGSQQFPIAAAIGAQANVIRETFQAPYVTNSGRFFHVGLKMPLGTATASQIIRGTVRVEGYFE
jgi:hypothetical protein